MNNSFYENKGLSGLANLGNTCFMNSCLQVLSHTYELNDFLNNEKFKQRLNDKIDTVILLEWDNLRKSLWDQNTTIIPKRFLQAVHKIAQMKKQSNFIGYLQNDVSEFFLFIIDCFHNSLSREINISIKGTTKNETDKLAFLCYEMIRNLYQKDYSEIWNLFYAVHLSKITRKDNQKMISITPEPYFMIDLPIPPNNKSPNLFDCLDYYISGESIEDYYDETAKEKTTIQKELQFWSFPTILTIDLKRFNSNFQKNQIKVDFPTEHLDLSKYVVGYQKETYKYELYGVCNHSGNVMGGHYTAYVKNANGKWYLFNDTSVSEVGDTNQIVSPKAYGLKRVLLT